MYGIEKAFIKGCPVSDHGMKVIAVGYLNFVKVKVKKCTGVTCEGEDWLRANKGSLAANLDTAANEPLDIYPSDVVVVEYKGLISHIGAKADTASSRNDRYFSGHFGFGLSFDLEYIEDLAISLHLCRVWRLVRICVESRGYFAFVYGLAVTSYLFRF
ncbi:hypothetical protein GIB67_008827 [Kingdonia uniflora]|uniref:Uncharacterized protein n=1 Tax=Kingdonia uniflora TaxID=39325 RepID=A0A7J7LV37_9MAGN|nr:hypothetical protein GIB67_008827 [Kingdonia uniflora]